MLVAITISNGATSSYNSMHDSYMSLDGAVLLVNMLLGEMIFGGLSYFPVLAMGQLSNNCSGPMRRRRPILIQSLRRTVHSLCFFDGKHPTISLGNNDIGAKQ